MDLTFLIDEDEEGNYHECRVTSYGVEIDRFTFRRHYSDVDPIEIVAKRAFAERLAKVFTRANLGGIS